MQSPKVGHKTGKASQEMKRKKDSKRISEIMFQLNKQNKNYQKAKPYVAQAHVQ